MSLLTYIKSKFVTLHIGDRYATGDTSFISDFPTFMTEMAQNIISQDKRLRIEIIGFNRFSTSYSVYLRAGSLDTKLMQAKAIRTAKLKHMIAKGVLQQ